MAALEETERAEWLAEKKRRAEFEARMESGGFAPAKPEVKETIQLIDPKVRSFLGVSEIKDPAWVDWEKQRAAAEEKAWAEERARRKTWESTHSLKSPAETALSEESKKIEEQLTQLQSLLTEQQRLLSEEKSKLESEQAERKETEAERAAKAERRKTPTQTILTSGQGVLGEAKTKKKSLLGE